MKTYVRVLHNQEPTYGIVKENSIHLLKGSMPQEFVLSGEVIPYEKSALLLPCTPQKIICRGLNYTDAILEDGVRFPKKPLLFLKPPSAMVQSGQYIVKNEMVEILTIEAELGVVIGKEGKNIPKEQAMDYVWGYLVTNDVTAKDLQKEDIQWTRAKSFDSFLPLSSEIIAEVDPSELVISAYINNILCQKGTTTDMLFDIKELICYISQIMTLLSGDIILTGTPGGYGKVVHDGDEVKIEIEKIGYITNYITQTHS